MYKTLVQHSGIETKTTRRINKITKTQKIKQTVLSIHEKIPNLTKQKIQIKNISEKPVSSAYNNNILQYPYNRKIITFKENHQIEVIHTIVLKL